MSPSTTSTQLLNSSRDGHSTTALNGLFQCLTSFLRRNFPRYPIWPYPETTVSLRPITSSEKRSWHPPPCRLLSGSYSVMTFSFSLFSTLSKLRSLSCCSSILFSRPFSGHTPAPRCPSCSEGPKTQDNIQGAASPEPRGKSFSGVYADNIHSFSLIQ